MKEDIIMSGSSGASGLPRAGRKTPTRIRFQRQITGKEFMLDLCVQNFFLEYVISQGQ
jgi:hypothetical protein